MPGAFSPSVLFWDLVLLFQILVSMKIVVKQALPVVHAQKQDSNPHTIPLDCVRVGRIRAHQKIDCAIIQALHPTHQA